METIFDQAVSLMNKHRDLERRADTVSARRWHNQCWYHWLRVAADHA
jgi:hypothetical protein